MGVSLKLGNLWRVIREVDLEAIRASANAPFELWVIDDGGGEAAALRAHLSGDARVPPPAVRIVRADNRALIGTVQPAAAIVMIPAPSPAIDDMLAALRKAQVPTVVIVPETGAAGDALVPGSTVPANTMTGSTAPGNTVPGNTVASRALPGQAAPGDIPRDGPAGDGRSGSTATPRVDERIVSANERHLRIPVLDATAIPSIATALVNTVPADLRLALARQLPAVRPAVFEVTIEETARANASYALTSGLAEVVPMLTVPLNLGDMVVLTKNQLIMSYRLVLAAGRDGEPRALLREILGVLGGGLLFRQLARQLVGLIPVAGLVPKVAIAYGGTWAIGRAVALWVTDGREVTGDLVRSLSTEGLQRGRAVAARMIEGARTQTSRASRRWERLKDQLPIVGRRR